MRWWRSKVPLTTRPEHGLQSAHPRGPSGLPLGLLVVATRAWALNASAITPWEPRGPGVDDILSAQSSPQHHR